MNIKAWVFLFRPWSYTATLVPFLLAAAIGIHSEGAFWGHWAIGLVSGLFFQSTVNLLNTWGDERSGVDNVPGAIRTTPQVHEGLVSLQAVLIAGLVCACLAGASGLALTLYRLDGIWHVNWPLFVAGLIGFLGSTNYSTGIKFKYHGLGVPFVSFLMGPLEIFVAIALLLPHKTPALLRALADPAFLLTAALVTLPIAALVGVIMHGNDMRDISSDRAAGIVTLASRLGPRGALLYYRLCHLLPYVIALLLAFTRSPWALLPFLILPLSLRTLRKASQTYAQSPDNPPWRKLERASGGIHLLFGILYSLAFAVQ